MRLLLIIGQIGYGGAEIVCADLARAMVREGHEVTVFVFERAENELIASLRDGGVKLCFGADRVSSPLAWRALFALLRRERYDLVHCHLFPALYAGPLIKALHKGRMIYTEHSPGNRRRSYRAFQIAEKAIYRCYDAVVAVSDSVAAELRAWQPGIAGKLRMIHNGVDFERFRNAKAASRKEFGIPKDATVLVEVGAFRVEKNQQLAIRALPALGPGYWLLLAGAGEELEPCRRLAASLGVAERVIFCGVRHDVERLLKASDLYVQTASHFEGFCIAAFEAAASGLPVVFPPIDGLALLHSFGRSYQTDDTAAFTAAVAEVCGNEAVRKDLVRKGYAAANRMSVEVTRAEYAKLYEELLGSASATAATRPTEG